MTSADQTDTRLSEAAGTWRLDPAATTILLNTKAMFGLVKVKAKFAATEGSATITEDGQATGTLVVDAASVDTGTKKRDTHLRGPDFFEVERFPSFTYTATGASAGPAGTILVDGSLEVHGTSQPLQVPVTITELLPESATITAAVDLNRTKWGVTWAKMGAKVDNHIVITARFDKQ